MNAVCVARELAPVGARSGPALCLQSMGLLRSPTGASSLATGYFSVFLTAASGLAPDGRTAV
ncbi:hypothetical protein EXW73_20870 [Pseudomonas sp. BCA13]|nr:hypothetical protein EXW73_20870 [Pseudomonas sp. BCA13]